MANGMAKLGKRAWTRASLANDASLSAVSTKRKACWSRNPEIICCHGDRGGGRSRELVAGILFGPFVAQLSFGLEFCSTYRTLFHLPGIAGPLDQGQETHKELSGAAGKPDDLTFPNLMIAG